MYEDNTTAHQSFVDEATGGGEVDEEVGIVDILNRNPQMPVPGRGVVGRYGLASDRHYMADLTVREDPRRLCSVDPNKPEGVSPELVDGGKNTAVLKKHSRPEEQPSFDDRVDVPPGGHVECVCRRAESSPSTRAMSVAAMGFVELGSLGGSYIPPWLAPPMADSSTPELQHTPSWQKQRTGGDERLDTARLSLQGTEALPPPPARGAHAS